MASGAAKTIHIEGDVHPAKLYNHEEVKDLLVSEGIQCLVNEAGEKIYGYAGLEHGGNYKRGKPIAASAKATRSEQDWTYAHNRVKQLVAHVNLPQQGRTGTCFVVEKNDEEWLLLTNEQVAGGELVDECQVKFSWSDPIGAKIVFFYKPRGLAILSIPSPFGAPSCAVLSQSRVQSRGFPLAVVGFHGDTPTIEPGVCTSLDSPNNKYCLATSALLHSLGDSGAPVVGTLGELLGVAVPRGNPAALQEADLITVASVEFAWEKFKKFRAHRQRELAQERRKKQNMKEQ